MNGAEKGEIGEENQATKQGRKMKGAKQGREINCQNREGISKREGRTDNQMTT